MARNNQRSRWAEKINAAWRSSIEAIFECGHLLIAAKEKPKEKLAHGDFQKMVDHDLRFGDRTAQRLMAIARDQRLTNPTHVSLLPQSWGTLYELTRLNDEQFSSAIRDGLIRPDMRRSDIAEMVDRWEEDEQRWTGRQTSPPVSQNTGGSFLPPQSAWRTERAANRIETITDNHLVEHMKRHGARQILESLLRLETESTRYDEELTLELLLDPANADKLERVRRGISFVIQLKGALDQKGLGGNPALRLIHTDDAS